MRQDLYDRIVDYIVGNQDKFYRLAFSYVHNQDDALDIVQNAVCQALDHYSSLRDENAIKTWFYRILVNESMQFIKRQKRELPLEEGMAEELPFYEKGYDRDDDLGEHLERLEGEVQAVIKLRYFEEMSLKEISLVTKSNLNTVKARLYRGLKQLKQNIQEVEG